MTLKSIFARGLLCPLFAVAVLVAKADPIFLINPDGSGRIVKVQEGVYRAIPNPGYRFDQWIYPSSSEPEIRITTDLACTVNFGFGIYTISFDANGGTPSELASLVVTNESSKAIGYPEFTVPTRSGYTFGGWTTNGVAWTVKKGDRIWLTDDVQAVAKWEKLPVVTFDFQDGAGGTTEVTPTLNQSMPTITIPAREGYAFVGYYTAENGSGTKYYNEDGTSAKKWDKTEDLRLYAKWTAKTYNVSKSTDTGTLYVNQTGTFGKSLEISFIAPTEAGYNFEKPLISIYAAGAAGGDLIYELSNKTQGTFTMGDNTNGKYYDAIAITAAYQRVAKIISVSFDGNGGTLDGSTKRVTYGSQYGDLPQATRTGYNFLGWFTYSSGGVQITNETKVTAVNDQTLYAHWQAKTYRVTYSVNNGSGNGSYKDIIFGENYVLPETNPTWTGYVFEGWYTDSTGGAKVDSYTKMERAEPHELYAHWSADKYQVTFDPNGGSVSQTIIDNLAYGSPYGELPTPNREGFEFAGWYTSGGMLVTAETNVMTAANHTLYAHWTAKNYTVTTATDGDCAITVATLGTFKQPLSIAWRANAVVGYSNQIERVTICETESGSGQKLVEYTSGSGATFTMATTYYSGIIIKAIAAKVPNSYTVKFDANGARGKMDSISCTYDKAFDLPKQNSYTNLTANFLGWSRDPKAETPTWGDAESGLKNLAADEGAVVTLYAVWQDLQNELTRAAHGQNVILETKGTYPFMAYTNETGETSARSGKFDYPDSCELSVTVNGVGVLSYVWKIVGEPDNFILSVDDDFVDLSGSDVGSGWKRVDYRLNENKEHKIIWYSVASNPEVDYLLVDKVEWQPASWVDEPTEADRRDISAVTMENGKLAISFENADSRFAYSLHGTNDLTAARALWPIFFTTNGTGKITIKPEVKADEKQFFYYLEVHSK